MAHVVRLLFEAKFDTRGKSKILLVRETCKNAINFRLHNFLFVNLDSIACCLLFEHIKIELE